LTTLPLSSRPRSVARRVRSRSPRPVCCSGELAGHSSGSLRPNTVCHNPRCAGKPRYRAIPDAPVDVSLLRGPGPLAGHEEQCQRHGNPASHGRTAPGPHGDVAPLAERHGQRTAPEPDQTGKTDCPQQQRRESAEITPADALKADRNRRRPKHGHQRGQWDQRKRHNRNRASTVPFGTTGHGRRSLLPDQLKTLPHDRQSRQFAPRLAPRRAACLLRRTVSQERTATRSCPGRTRARPNRQRSLRGLAAVVR